LAIKNGDIPYAQVAAEIEELLEEVTAMESKSSLPETPDMDFIDDLVAEAYGTQVMG